MIVNNFIENNKMLVAAKKVFWTLTYFILLVEQIVGNPAGFSSTKDNPKNCLEILNGAEDPSQLDDTIPYDIYPFGTDGPAISTRCDFNSDGGGWTIIQQRDSGPKYEFFLGWAEYEEGFGSRLGNYWIGLKTIHALTSASRQELRVDLGDWEGLEAFAKYDSFTISNSSDFYRLAVSGYYAGKAWDSLTEFTEGVTHNGMRFSTKDMDNDESATTHCALFGEGAWWFNECSYSDLNAAYLEYPNHLDYSVRWGSWRDPRYSLKKTAMKVRDYMG